MDFSIVELQFLNKHLDYVTASSLRNWIKYDLYIYKNLSDVEAKEVISDAIHKDSVSYDPNKGSLFPYLQQSITLALIGKSTKLHSLPKEAIISEAGNTKYKKWVDLSYFKDEELRLLYMALVKNQVNQEKIKRILDGYITQVNKGK